MLVNEYLETNIPDVYAAGDCAEIYSGENANSKRIEQLWYTGRMQGETLARTLCGDRTKYERGIWFNSAKFFDIEYQTYGFVSRIPREKESSFYWESESHRHALRIVYHKNTKVVRGINVFGIRMRQDICQKWIRERKDIGYVMNNLYQANFDPEFFTPYLDQIARKFHENNRLKTSAAQLQ